MGLFGRKNKKVNNILATKSNPFVFGLDDYPWINSNNNELKLSAVNAAITTIAATMSKIPFFVMNEKTKERLDDKNIYKLLNIAPNEIMNATVMNGLLATWLLCEGEAFVLPVRKFRSNEIEARIPFHPSKVNKYIDKTNYKLYYELTFLDGHTERKPADDVEHYMWFTKDGINGISPLEYARNTIQSGLNQDEYNQYVYKAGCRPKDYIKYETDIPFDDVELTVGYDDKGNPIKKKFERREAIRREWERSNGKTAILDGGSSYNTVTPLTPEQTQFVASKDVTVQDIARFFRMGSCMYKLGVGKQSYSTNEQAQICYINETILPIVRQWEHEMTIKILPKSLQDQGWQIRGNEKVELRGDTASQLAWLKGNKEMGVYNINEVRKILELPEIGELGDVRTIGPNAVPLEKAVSGETAGQATPNPISGDNNEQDGNETNPDNNKNP